MKQKREKKIIGFSVRQMPDVNPFTDDLGKYTDKAEPWAIVRETGRYIADMDDDEDMPPQGREYRYFIPYAGGETPGTEDYKKYGLQDWGRMEELERGDWYFVGIRAEAKVQLAGDLVQTITSGGLWGVESDCGKDDMDMIAGEQIEDLRSELSAIGFSKAQLNAALKWDGEFTD